MKQTVEQTYADLLRQLSSPRGVKPEALAEAFRDVERLHAWGDIEDWQMQNAREAFARTGGNKASEAMHWVMNEAKDTLHSAAGQVRKQASRAVATYTHADPVRAMLVAAATGAILMGLVSMMARSGVRSVRRRFEQ